MSNEIIEYRRSRAVETLNEATLLLEHGLLYAAVNRIYYACFYEVSALLLKDKQSSAKHSGVKSLFNVHYIHTGKIDAKLGKFYSRIFEYRQKGDYADMVHFENKPFRNG